MVCAWKSRTPVLRVVTENFMPIIFVSAHRRCRHLPFSSQEKRICHYSGVVKYIDRFVATRAIPCLVHPQGAIVWCYTGQFLCFSDHVIDHLAQPRTLLRERL